MTDREDKLNADNKLAANNYQAELAKGLGSLSRTVALSMSRQDEHLQSVDKLCHSLIDGHSKVATFALYLNAAVMISKFCCFALLCYYNDFFSSLVTISRIIQTFRT